MTERENLDGDPTNSMLYVAITQLMKGVETEARGPNCPKCGEAVEKGDNYCTHCGQKLKWRDR